MKAAEYMKLGGIVCMEEDQNIGINEDKITECTNTSEMQFNSTNCKVVVTS